jgi:hypothetical protein
MRTGSRKDRRSRAGRAGRRRLWAWVGGLGLLVGSAVPVQAQQPGAWNPCAPSPANAPAGAAAVPLVPMPSFPLGAAATPGPEAPGRPSTAQQPTTPQQPSTQPQQPSAQAQPSESLQNALAGTENAMASAGEAPGGESGGLALGGTEAATGYIDQAIPLTQFRLRFDAAYDDNRPDRAEFIYPKCGCFASNLVRTKAPGIFDPRAPGPGMPETSIDYQEISSYLEVAFSNRFSAFVELPVRFLNPEVNPDTSGLGDMNVGFKYALVACPDRYVTLQFRTYIPTGDPAEGLGTDHVSLEPALLWHQNLTNCLFLDSELRDWVPIGGTDFAGNVVRYGVGLSYLVLNRPRFRIIPVGEVVGWSVLSGKELVVPSVAAAMNPLAPGNSAVQDAAGDTIVNAKIGVRFGFGAAQDQGYLSRSDLYVGYGRALTGDVWYKDIFRVEFRLLF